MATNINNLLNKEENKGETVKGKLSAHEFNNLVTAVIENQEEAKKTVKSVTFNGIKSTPDFSGNINIVNMETNYSLKIYTDIPDYEVIPGVGYKVAHGSSLRFQTTIEHKYVNGEQIESQGTPCSLTYFCNGIIVGKEEGKDGETLTFDFGPFLEAIPNNIIYVTVDNHLGNHPVESKRISVAAVSLNVKLPTFNYLTVQKTNPWELPVLVESYDISTVSIIIDDFPAITGVHRKNEQITYKINKGCTSGVHTLKVYAQDEDKLVKTEPLEYVFLYSEEQNDNVLIASLLQEGHSIEEYHTLLLQYWMYSKDFTGRKKVKISLVNPEKIDEVYFESEQFISFNKGTTGLLKQNISLFNVGIDNHISKVNRDVKIIVTDIGSEEVLAEKSIPIVIKKSSTDLVDVPSYLFYFTAANKSNASEKDKKLESNGYSITLPEDFEFSEVGSGWNEDSDGNTALHLRRNRFITLNYQPFLENPCMGNDSSVIGTKKGLTFSIEFASRDCTKKDSTIVSCINDGVGFELYANSLKFDSKNESLSCDYREDTRVKVDLVIEGNTTHYKYTRLKDNTVHEDDEAFMFVYIDGVYQGIQLLSPTSDFKQNKAQKITIGSSDCDIDIYSIRAYERALSMQDIVQNYSYDTPRVEDKIAIAERNNIFSEQKVDNKFEVSLSKLREARPNLPLFLFSNIEKNSLPITKKDWRNIGKTEYVNPANKKDYYAGNSSFVATDAGWANQGTSSMSYPLPYRNFDWALDWAKAGDTTKLEVDNQTYNEWVIYGGVNPVKSLTFKKDYASSEMVNNVICSDLYNTMAAGIADLSSKDPEKWRYSNVLSPSQVKDGKDKYKLALKGIPTFMFYKDADLKDKPMGMFNIIPNKYEVEYLGFLGDNIWDPDHGHYAQSWELQTNNVTWAEYAIPIHMENGKVVSNLTDDFYEARYPSKKSKVKIKDFGTASSEDQIPMAWSRHKDLFFFHNWMVDTNKLFATNKLLTQLNEERLANRPKEGPIPGLVDGVYTDILGNKYTKDDRKYRLAKFKTEGEYHWSSEMQDWVPGGYLRLDQWILYYLWMEQYWMYDSGAKNLQIYTMGKRDPEDPEEPLEWGCMVRDADTGLGIDNIGRLSFPPHLEYSDFKKGGEILYDLQLPGLHAGERPRGEDGSPDVSYQLVLNGQECAPWQNIKDGYPERVAEMYRELASNSNKTRFGYEESLEAFEGHQRQWSESLYNFGAYQYFGGGDYTYYKESGLGDKKNQRRFWLYYGFKYRGSKYETGTDNEALNWRVDGTLRPFDVKVYSPMYVTLYTGRITPGNANFKKRCVDPNKWTTIDVMAKDESGQSVTVNDMDCNLTFGDMYTDLSQLYKMSQDLNGNSAIHDVNLNNGKRLRKIGLGNKDEKGRNTVLKAIEVNQCSLLETLDITGCIALGSSEGQDISTRKYPLDISKLNQLQELYASDSFETSVTFPKTTTLKRVRLGEYLKSLDIVDLPSLEEFTLDGTANIESVNVRNVGDKINTYAIANKILQNKKLTYFAFENVNWTDVGIDFLNRLVDLKESGETEIDLTGRIKVKGIISFELKGRLLKAFGNIDDERNPLYIQYSIRDLESIVTTEKLYFRKPGEYQLTFDPRPLSGNNYTHWEWKIVSNNYATVTPEGLLQIQEIGDEKDLPSATVTITVYKIGGTKVESTIEAYFYNRVAKPGYYVFHDGTYGPDLEANKTPIGICFWVDPQDDQNRLMMGLKYLGSDFYTWGPDISSFLDTELQDSPGQNIWDVPNLPASLDGFADETTNDDQYRRSPEAGGDIYGFRNDYPSTTVWSQLGNYIVEKDVAGHITGEKIPYGKFFTDCIIHYRDRILQDGVFLENAPKLPAATMNDTEFDNLRNILSGYLDEGGQPKPVYHAYFPAASACDSYNPMATTLQNESAIADKFKEGNWFLPSAGELGRIQYYFRKTDIACKDAGVDYNPEDPNNVFQKALNEGVLKLRVGAVKSSSVPTDAQYFSGLEIGRARVYDILRRTARVNYQVLPICKF